MDAAEKAFEKSKIDKEIQAWFKHDQAYVYTLVAYALQQGFITEEEAAIAKDNLDNYWNEETNRQKEKVSRQSKYMMAVLKKIGFTPTKILWRLTDQFPKYMVGNAENCEFVAHDEPIMKAVNIDSINYYKIINDLVDANFLSKRMDNKKMIYKINFMLIVETYKEEQSKKTV